VAAPRTAQAILAPTSNNVVKIVMHVFVVRDGVRIAKRENKKWVSLVPGVTVRDTKDKRHPGIEITYSGVSH
jgi:hypothetical protein